MTNEKNFSELNETLISASKIVFDTCVELYGEVDFFTVVAECDGGQIEGCSKYWDQDSATDFAQELLEKDHVQMCKIYANWHIGQSVQVGMEE